MAADTCIVGGSQEDKPEATLFKDKGICFVHWKSQQTRNH